MQLLMQQNVFVIICQAVTQKGLRQMHVPQGSVLLFLKYCEKHESWMSLVIMHCFASVCYIKYLKDMMFCGCKVTKCGLVQRVWTLLTITACCHSPLFPASLVQTKWPVFLLCSSPQPPDQSEFVPCTCICYDQHLGSAPLPGETHRTW